MTPTSATSCGGGLSHVETERAHRDGWVRGPDRRRRVAGLRAGRERTAGDARVSGARQESARPPAMTCYLIREAGAPAPPGPAILLGPDLAHIEPGDIIHVAPDGSRVTVLWKNSAVHNGLLLTEQCDNYCLMCSQPPKDRDDSWLFHRASEGDQPAT